MTSRQRCSGSEGGEKGPDRRAAAETSADGGAHGTRETAARATVTMKLACEMDDAIAQQWTSSMGTHDPHEGGRPPQRRRAGAH
ncbi:hypothetical protein EMIHUDRAFT_231238 [Emiliania huxleyi CCMP1516]|uniref:Uncharacterized protein n=2 Tax=Emiliania huxleyi TaxID=2903 RepID=A0A0D3K7U6_EMIH1|nr:hypothetical protein EMIHUDRAFT_231238 [Emiliania huxleyi CCMP1516]EOD31831.1 hypothetical protein EMIHUDRAFT_231238 [Emiliania huxleyi CCMP1516]|eukprot:XP_005784260.1 hypothetical protein EMIHUDRAFT_231238 [Emiliania huxleyi CCMP1516]